MICNECVVVAIAPELEKCWTVSCGCIIHWCIFVEGTFGTMSMSVWCIGIIQISLAGWFPTNLIHAKIFPAVQTKEDMIQTTMYEYHDSVNEPYLVILGIACLKEGYLQYQAKKKNKKNSLVTIWWLLYIFSIVRSFLLGFLKLPPSQFHWLPYPNRPLGYPHFGGIPPWESWGRIVSRTVKDEPKRSCGVGMVVHHNWSMVTLGGNAHVWTIKCIKDPWTKNIYMDVSENRGTPKSSILIGFSITSHPFWVSLFLETPIYIYTYIWCWHHTCGLKS